ncbi:protein kinase domain-containing protein [Actinomadura macra]|uniref:protein kinase domain-containing protein n=1 Tax=Actinomadura macra TaxID=46164 RepID=UPI000AD624D9|nr:hypothetical protein [Actinomadura macra]
MSGETSHQEHIGPYRLLSRLGGGTVHRAAGPDGRDVAIRLLPPGADPDLARMREVLSPYVVDVLDGEPAGPAPYVVSRFVPGRPMAEHVTAQGAIGGAELRRMALGLAKALAAIHQAGLAHGDLGPGTVLVVDGAPVVIDFGLARGDAPGDIAGWGAVVAFAATGRQDAPADALPVELRRLVAAATDPDPGARPSAAELAEAASGLDLPPAAVPVPRSAVPSPQPSPRPAAPAVSTVPEWAGAPGTAAEARGLAVARGWARLLAAMVVVIGVGVAVMMPIVGLVLSLAAVTLLRAAAERSVRGWASAFGRTLLTVPYAALFTVAVPLGLVAVSAVGGEIDSLGACAFGAGAGAAVLWTAPGVRAPRRQMERMALATARQPRGIAVAGAVLGVFALLAVVGAMSLTPSFAPMYGLQSSLESSVDRLQHAVDRM